MKKVWKFLCSMKFALILLTVLVLVCTAGSVISQGQPERYYEMTYSETGARLILTLGLDDVFHCWWFVVMAAGLCVNLLACSIIRFPVLIRQMKEGFDGDKKVSAWQGKPSVTVREDQLDRIFREMGFQRTETGADGQGRTYRYSVRHRVGIWGAWLCHLGMLIIIIGFSLGQHFKTVHTVYGVPGQTKEIGETGYELTIDDFRIALREDETVEQYTSWLTVTETGTGKTVSGEVSVNHPMSALGMKLYQNSTGWAATVRVSKGGQILQESLVCTGEYVEIEDMPELVVGLTAFYPDFAYGSDGMPMTLSSSLKNPAYLYVVYYQENVIGMNVLLNDYISIDDYIVEFVNPEPYTLIQIKTDPYIWIAAVGALLVMAALLLAFYVRPEELWAVRRPDGDWDLGGDGRKSGEMFWEKLDETVKRG